MPFTKAERFSQGNCSRMSAAFLQAMLLLYYLSKFIQSSQSNEKCLFWFWNLLWYLLALDQDRIFGVIQALTRQVSGQFPVASTATQVN